MIERVEKDQNTAKSLIRTAEEHLNAAFDNIKIKHYDWAVAIAYSAMLNAGRALMAARGYRPESESHHLAVVRFCSEILGKETEQLVILFNRYRVRRHDIVYGEKEKSVSESEAMRSVENAKKFVEEIKKRI
ncbi:MAG: HEPN domain-containing protein [Candidatus Anstonellales archaeon]